MRYLLILAAVFLALSCSRKPGTIMPVDFGTFEKAMNSGSALTQQDVNKLMADLQEEVQKNTAGKQLPDVQVMDLPGNRFNLPDMIRRKTIIAVSDAHCGIGKGCTMEDLPKIITRLKKQYDDFDVICLVVRTKADIDDPAAFKSYLAGLKPLYPVLCVMEEEAARKMNVFGSPTRLLIDKNRTVVKIKTGMAVDPEVLYDELAGFLMNVHSGLFQ
ncbi:MAG TPA: hypothetical protein PKH58_08855 [Paludibacteraceae bacterium]|nr:hypothetical protein [Paludibacteraceae bacterium]